MPSYLHFSSYSIIFDCLNFILKATAQGFSDPIGLSLSSKDIVCSLSAATAGYIFEVEECSMHSFK
jgi:hypothetical protein